MTEFLDRWDGDIVRALRFQDEEICELAANKIEELRAALDLYREAVRIDATMEGPKFMGSNASALKRAWDADRAAFSGEQQW